MEGIVYLSTFYITYLITRKSPSLLFIMTFNDRRVVIILEIDVIKRAEEVAGKIGDPTPYSEGKTNPLSLCPDSKLVNND